MTLTTWTETKTLDEMLSLIPEGTTHVKAFRKSTRSRSCVIATARCFGWWARYCGAGKFTRRDMICWDDTSAEGLVRRWWKNGYRGFEFTKED